MHTSATAPKTVLRNPWRLGQIYYRRRYTILFFSLIFTLVTSPAIGALGLSGSLIEFLLAANILAAVLPESTNWARNVLLGAMVVLWVARPITAWSGHRALSTTMLLAGTVVGLFAAALALRFALSGTKIHAEHLYAALSAYILSGLLFGLLYWALQQLTPGALAVNGALSRTSASYFSFVTLATLGYGDIVPRTDIARGLAVCEGIGGQLFLAAFVARLLTLYTHHD